LFPNGPVAEVSPGERDVEFILLARGEVVRRLVESTEDSNWHLDSRRPVFRTVNL